MIAIIRTLADKYGFDEVEALDIAQKAIKEEMV